MHRHERFQTEFLNKIANLLKVLTPYLISKHREMPQETKQLNQSIAEFLKVIIRSIYYTNYIVGNINLLGHFMSFCF